jgi:hypothetical protein
MSNFLSQLHQTSNSKPSSQSLDFFDEILFIDQVNTNIIFIIGYNFKYSDPWECCHFVCFYDINLKKILQYTKSESYRGLFGIIKNDDNEIVIVNTKYVDTNKSINSSEPSICVEYYNIETICSELETICSEPNYKFQKIREIIIKMDTTCGMTEGKICNVGNNIFNIIYGDLVNYDFCEIATIKNKEIAEKNKISLDLIDYNIENNYFLSSKIMFISHILAVKNTETNAQNQINKYNKINMFITVRELEKEKTNTTENDNKEKIIFATNEIDLPNMFYDCLNDELDSKIIDFNMFNKIIFCLIQVKLNERSDILHSKEFTIDILVNITEMSIVEIKNKKYESDKNNSSSCIKVNKINGTPYIHYNNLNLV